MASFPLSTNVSSEAMTHRRSIDSSTFIPFDSEVYVETERRCGISAVDITCGHDAVPAVRLYLCAFEFWILDCRPGYTVVNAGGHISVQ